jgi:hypothetical protein
VEGQVGGPVDAKVQSGHAGNLLIGDGDITAVPNIGGRLDLCFMHRRVPITIGREDAL